MQKSHVACYVEHHLTLEGNTLTQTEGHMWYGRPLRGKTGACSALGHHTQLVVDYLSVLPDLTNPSHNAPARPSLCTMWVITSIQELHHSQPGLTLPGRKNQTTDICTAVSFNNFHIARLRDGTITYHDHHIVYLMAVQILDAHLIHLCRNYRNYIHVKYNFLTTGVPK